MTAYPHVAPQDSLPYSSTGPVYGAAMGSYTAQAPMTPTQQPVTEDGWKEDKTELVELEKPERSTFLLAWFTLFSLLSFVSVVIALISCLSNSTSNLYIASLRPTEILNTSFQYLGLLEQNHTISSTTTRNGTRSTNSTSTKTPVEQYFTPNTIPDRYLIGMSGICREYNNSGSHCTTRLWNPEFDLLTLLAEDIPNASNSTQFESWRTLLNQITSSKISSDPTGFHNRNRRMAIAGTALCITSAIFGMINLILTLTVRRLYPRGATALAVFDALMLLAACSLWSAGLISTREGYNPGGVVDGLRTGPGYWLLWAAASSKLAVTPALMIKQIIAILMALAAMLYCISVCCKVFAALCPPSRTVTTETVYYNYSPGINLDASP